MGHLGHELVPEIQKTGQTQTGEEGEHQLWIS